MQFFLDGWNVGESATPKKRRRGKGHI